MAIGNGVVIRFLADTGSAVRDITKLERATGRSMTRMGKASAIWSRVSGAAFTAVTAGATAAAVAAGAAMKAAAEDQAEQTKLAQAMKNTTDATDEQIAAMEEYVTTAQRKTGMDDGQIRDGLKLLLRATKDTTRAQALSNVAQKIALETGTDYQRVIKALIRAEDGNFSQIKKITGGIGEQAQNYSDVTKASKDYATAQEKAGIILAQYGPKSNEYADALKNVNDKARKLAQAKGDGYKWLAELNDQFRGSIANDAKTYAGGLRRVGTAWDELVESFGAGLMGDTDASGQMNDLADSMYEAQPAARMLGETLNNTLVPAMVDFVKGLAAIGPYWDTFVQTVSGGVTSVGDFLGVIPDDVAASMQRQYEEQIARNNATLQTIAVGAQPTPVNPYALYRPMNTAQRYRDATRGADARGAAKDARTRQPP